ncbi:aromatic amino acid ammonia-lyase [Vulcanisaeta thermophila]|uniref:aromatic amino acid ammonia-lyase n=1 Tax=Vulcanisaeta thermophila TaxID=867917 RepID=UPI000852E6E8|nr:aromatic amino acid ammonia-lyase [Vulcanisaeta thermophila]
MVIKLGNKLSITDIVSVARNHEEVAWDEDVRSRVINSRRRLEELIGSGIRIYGVNTGLGDLYSMYINPEEVTGHSEIMLQDHAKGVGEAAPEDWVRATMLIRAHQLALGHSGVRDSLIDLMIQFLNLGITPVIPRYGSVGASGDLAPLAHMSLALIGKGMVLFRGRVMPSIEALKAVGLRPLELSYKEALALINGTSYSTAVAALGLWDSINLIKSAMAVMALALEASNANSSAFNVEVNLLKLHGGEQYASRVITKLIEDSGYIDTSGRVQDPYSLRCIPQVVGSVWDSLNWALGNVVNEVNSVSDNPVIVDGGVKSACHFHGEYVALSTDLANMSLAVLGNLIERQVAQLLRADINGVGNYLTSGAWSVGLMITQYTAAALAARLREVAVPSTVNNIPTSGLQEDLNSMSANSALKLHEVNEVIRQLISILGYVAVKVIDAKGGCSKCGSGTRRIYEVVKDSMKFATEFQEAIKSIGNSLSKIADLIV